MARYRVTDNNGFVQFRSQWKGVCRAWCERQSADIGPLWIEEEDWQDHETFYPVARYRGGRLETDGNA